MPFKCRTCQGPHLTFRCPVKVLKLSEDDIFSEKSDEPPQTPKKKHKGVTFSDEKLEPQVFTSKGSHSVEEVEEALSPSISVRLTTRVDDFLWYVRIYKRRNHAKQACKKGNVRVVTRKGESRVIKPSTKIGVGSELLIHVTKTINQTLRGMGPQLCLIVRETPKGRVSAKKAAFCYELDAPVQDLIDVSTPKSRHKVEALAHVTPIPLKKVKSLATLQLEEDFVVGFDNKEVYELTGGTVDVSSYGSAAHKVVAKAESPQQPCQESSANCATRHGSGFIRGEENARERAAYLLDKCYNHFSGVPQTTIVKVKTEKGMSDQIIQRFVDGAENAAEYGSGFFKDVPARQLHKVAVLDIRLFNTDRHGGNIMWKCPGPRSERDWSKCELIPIDHGGCLPDYCHLTDARFDWRDWKQASVPFDDETRHHIMNLDPMKEREILRRKLHIREECVITHSLCCTLLKKCVMRGFTLKQIAALMEDITGKPTVFSLLVDNTLRALHLPKPTLSRDVVPPPNSKEFLLVFEDKLDDYLAIQSYEMLIDETGVETPI